MKNKHLLFLLGLFYIFSYTPLNAAPAYPGLIKKIQPDGTEITIQLHGNEHASFVTTIDGLLLVENSEGVYEYARMSPSGELVSSRIAARNPEERSVADQINAESLTHYQDYLATHQALQKSEMKKRRAVLSEPAGVPQTTGKYPYNTQIQLEGELHTLVILVNFADKKFVTPNPREAFYKFFNEPGYNYNGASGSVRDFYHISSSGRFTPTFDVVGPYELPDKAEVYGSNTPRRDANVRQMVADACSLAYEAGVDYRRYSTVYSTQDKKFSNEDVFRVANVTIVFAGHSEAQGGNANTTIWPHRSAIITGPGGNHITESEADMVFDNRRVYSYTVVSELTGRSGSRRSGIGTTVHEFGHVLGLPDFYASGTHHTLHRWSVMDVGLYLNNENSPPALSAYERLMLGWIQPKILKTPGSYTLDVLTESNQAFMISPTNRHNMDAVRSDPQEYFLLENRQKKGLDSHLPGHGMLITRINLSNMPYVGRITNDDPDNMAVDIIEADGIANVATLAGDPFPGASRVTSFSPKLHTGEVLGKDLTRIKEEGDIINFEFMRIHVDEDSPVSAISSYNEYELVVAPGVELKVDKSQSYSAVSVGPGGRLTFEPGAMLNAPLYLKSDAGGTATVTGDFSVRASVEQYINKYRSWYLSLPVNAGRVQGAANIYQFVESEENEKATGWSEGVPKAGMGVLVNPEKGEDKLVFEGVLNSGDFHHDYLTARFKRFNYMGNPYASYLNWSDLEKENLEKTIWFRTQVDGVYTFATYNGVVGTFTADDVIAPMQGFWVRVQADKSRGGLRFSNKQRKHLTDFKPADHTILRGAQAGFPLLRLEISNGSLKDESVIYFKEENSNGKDGYDAAKLMCGGKTPEIWTELEGEATVINAMRSVPYNEGVRIGVDVPEKSELSIRLSDFSGFPVGDRVVLTDMENGVTADITETEYRFTTEAVKTNERFVLRFIPAFSTGAEQIAGEELFVSAAGGEIVVHHQSCHAQARASLFTAEGRLLTSQRLRGNATSLAQGVQAGVYLVVLELPEGKITRRVVIN